MKTVKAFLAALLVAAIVLAATSISWGGNGNGSGNDPALVGDGGGYSLLGATWE
ncbi:MAG TPA: hypothetical protein VGR24_10525 [bacterium]|jgi:hypothetical protein|nr:hypothetical protein [bacterium]